MLSPAPFCRLRLDELNSLAVDDAFRRQEADDPVVSISILEEWTNDTFATVICNASSPLVQTIQVTRSVPGGQIYVLPDCFYDSFPGLGNIVLTEITVMGNQSSSDPWLRLTQSIPQLQSLQLIGSRFLAHNGSIHVPDLQSLLDSSPNLNTISMNGMILGGPFLPLALPPILSQFSIQNCDLSGTIPDTLFSRYVSSGVDHITLDLSNNALTGTIPDLFLGSLPQNIITNLAIDLASNQLSGTIPSGSFGGPWPSLNFFFLDLQSNSFSGPMANLLASATFTKGTFQAFTMSLARNGFTGTFPTSWFAGQTAASCSTFFFDATNNQLSGTIPTSFIADYGFTTVNSIGIQLEGNSLSGAIPSLAGIPYSITTVSISYLSNLLSGPIPGDLFSPVPWAQMVSFIFAAGNNSFVGSLPTSFLNSNPATALQDLQLDFSYLSGLSGSIPPSFWTSLIPTSPVTSNTITSFQLNLEHSGVTGGLDLIPFSSRLQPLVLSLNMGSSNLNSITLAPGSAASLFILQLENCASLHGPLPSELFSDSSKLRSLTAFSSGLDGVMPDLGERRPPATLVLRDTNIDFCLGTRGVMDDSAVSICDLKNTNAVECAEYYPSCQVSRAPPSPTNVSSPASAPASGCRIEIRPSPLFVCIGGIWTYQGSFNTTVLTIPAGAIQTVIEGNVTSTSVVINGLGSTVIVYGCATNLSLITVTLTPEELKQIGSTGKTQRLLTVNSSQCGDTSLGAVAVAAHVSGKTCRKVTAKRVESAGTISGLFVVDSSGCNVWWIVLVSVICGVLVVVVAIAVVVLYIKKRDLHQAHRSLRQSSPR